MTVAPLVCARSATSATVPNATRSRLTQHDVGDAAFGGGEVGLAIVDALRGRH